MMDDFCEHPNWFDAQYAEKLGTRYPTFRIALNLLFQKPDHFIVETGTMRTRENWAEGNSTMLFAEFVSWYGGHLTSVDISQANMDVCKSATEQYASLITYMVEDSRVALRSMTQPIDLLYLDSLDFQGDGSEAQQHQLEEFHAAERLLAGTPKIVLLDDNHRFNGGKTRLTKQYLGLSGWTCVMNYHQSLWISPYEEFQT